MLIAEKFQKFNKSQHYGSGKIFCLVILSFLRKIANQDISGLMKQESLSGFVYYFTHF